MPQAVFDLDALAAYLHMTPGQIKRLVERGKIPGRKVGGDWRFSKSEIHHWLERRIGLSEDDQELADMESLLQRAATNLEPEEVRLVEMLPVEAIAIPLPARTPSSVHRQIAQLAAETGWLWDPDQMAEATQEREEMHTTAMDIGVALIHPRRPLPSILGQAFVALGIVHGGIPFGGGHGNLTDIFFLICSTDDRTHLRTLARLSRVVTTPGLLDTLRAAPDPPAARAIIVAAEAELD